VSVDAGGLKPNTWQRFERLSSSWNQAKLRFVDEPDGATDDEPEVVANPRRRLPTILTIWRSLHQSQTVGRAVESAFVESHRCVASAGLRTARDTSELVSS